MIHKNRKIIDSNLKLLGQFMNGAKKAIGVSIRNNIFALNLNNMILALTFEILKYLLPSIVLFFIVRLVVKSYLLNEEKKRLTSKNENAKQLTLPLQLQAYERIILLLERITPAQIISRTLQGGMTVYHMQKNMIQVIKEEFEHNVTQQIYVSPQGWALVKTAREEVIMLINTVSAETDPEAEAGLLARKVLEYWAQQDHNPVQNAIDKLKAEVRELL